MKFLEIVEKFRNEMYASYGPGADIIRISVPYSIYNQLTIEAIDLLRYNLKKEIDSSNNMVIYGIEIVPEIRNEIK